MIFWFLVFTRQVISFKVWFWIAYLFSFASSHRRIPLPVPVLSLSTSELDGFDQHHQRPEWRVLCRIQNDRQRRNGDHRSGKQVYVGCTLLRARVSIASINRTIFVRKHADVTSYISGTGFHGRCLPKFASLRAGVLSRSLSTELFLPIFPLYLRSVN